MKRRTDQTRELAARLARVESYQAIQQLAARYALAVDSKDLDGIAELFVSDVNAGRQWGVGRDAIKAFYRQAVSSFYRSMHLISGHVIEFTDPEHAHGVVYCRAEHESGPNWGIMVMNYKDDYEQEDGRWLFRRRRLQPLYTTDILERPTGPNFNQGWNEPKGRGTRPRLPSEYPTFARFWRSFPAEHIAAITVDPVDE